MKTRIINFFKCIMVCIQITLLPLGAYCILDIFSYGINIENLIGLLVLGIINSIILISKMLKFI